MAPHERIYVLLAVLGSERRIKISKDSVEPL
jgi:hypothetical protein